MSSYEYPKRKYNLFSVVFFPVFFAAWGYIIFTNSIPANLPTVPLFRRPTEEETHRFSVHQEPQSLELSEGRYQVYAQGATLRAGALWIQSDTTNERLAFEAMPPAITENLSEYVLIEHIEVETDDVYHFFTTTESPHSIMIIPDFSAMNRIRLIVFMLIGGTALAYFWFKTGRRGTTKEERQDKRDRFQDFMGNT